MRRKKTFRFLGVVLAALILSIPIGVHAATVFETTGFITGVEGVSHPFTADVGPFNYNLKSASVDRRRRERGPGVGSGGPPGFFRPYCIKKGEGSAPTPACYGHMPIISYSRAHLSIWFENGFF